MNDKMNRYDDTMYQNYNEELAPIMTTKIGLSHCYY